MKFQLLIHHRPNKMDGVSVKSIMFSGRITLSVSCHKSLTPELLFWINLKKMDSGGDGDKRVISLRYLFLCLHLSPSYRATYILRVDVTFVYT